MPDAHPVAPSGGELTPTSYSMFIVTEVVRYEVAAPTEEDAERLFCEHTGIDVEEPVRFLGIGDRDIVERLNEKGQQVVVCPPR